MKIKLHITMFFLVRCQFVIVLAMASTPAQRINAMVVSGSPNQRFVNEHSNRSATDLEFLDYINPEEKRKTMMINFTSEEINPAQNQRSISMTLEKMLIERANAFDYWNKKHREITTNYIRKKTDDDRLRSRFFVNQIFEREGNEKRRPLTDFNEKRRRIRRRSVTENRKELLHSTETLSLKKRATGNSTPESSSRKETTEILNRKIDVRSHSTPDLEDKETIGLKSVKENKLLFDVVQPLHQQTTNSKAIRTQHLQTIRNEEGEGPQALTLHRFNSHQSKHLLTPFTRQRKRKSRFSRQHQQQHSAQLNAAVAYQRALLHSLQLESADHSTIMKKKIPIFGLNKFNFNPIEINANKNEDGKNFDFSLSEGNFRKIPSEQVAFIPPKIIYETRIRPAPFMTDDARQKEFDDINNFFTRAPNLVGSGFDFIDSNREQHNSIAIKDTIPVTEKSKDDETSFTTEPSSQVSLPPVANEISNHRYEAALPIIKSVPLNHKFHNENVDETKGTPPQLEYSELTGVTSEFSQKEDIHNSNSRNIYPANGGKYNFGYRVSDHETGNDFGHEEQRDGDFTRGRYHVLLPDGRIQKVEYHVKDGYHAKVSYHYDH